MKAKMRFAALLGVFALVSCLPTQSGKGRITLKQYAAQHSASSCAAAFSEFSGSNGFYSYAKTLACNGCHGASQNPRYLQSDPASAYLAAYPYLNLGDPMQSAFVGNATNGHQQVMLSQNQQNDVKAKIQAWANAENACLQGSGVTPTPTPIVSQLCNGTHFLSFMTKVVGAVPGQSWSGLGGACMDCHRGAIPVATQKLNLSGTQVDQCFAAAGKVNKADPDNSLLVARLRIAPCTTRGYYAPPVYPSQTQIDRFTAWARETALLLP